MAFEHSKHYPLGVIIVNYRTPQLVEACLNSLSPMLERADAAIVVVDNASRDGSYERLSQFRREVSFGERLTVIEAPENGGFSAGNNSGVKAISSDYVLFLNSDALAGSGALDALLAAARDNPKAGLIAPKIVSSEGEREVSLFRNHTLLGEFVDGAQTGPVTRLFHHAEIPIFPEDDETEPDWASFAAILLSRAAIERAGSMDEGFFLYYEDCDYCRRVVDCGYEIAQAPQAVFIHDAGGSTKLRERAGKGARLPAYYYASRSRYYRKYYGVAGPLLANLFWYAGRTLAKLRGLLGRPAPRVPDKRAQDIWIGWRGRPLPRD